MGGGLAGLSTAVELLDQVRRFWSTPRHVRSFFACHFVTLFNRESTCDFRDIQLLPTECRT